MNWNRKILLHNLFLLLLLCIPTIVVVSCKDSNFQSATIQKYVEQEKELIWDSGFELNTALLGSGESITVTYTVLAESTSSVRFTLYPDERIIWSPIPINFTLAPDESFTETFHLNSSAIDGHDMLTYVASKINVNQTATVQWRYEVLNGKLPSIDLISTFAILTTISIFSTIILKRKR